MDLYKLGYQVTDTVTGCKGVIATAGAAKYQTMAFPGGTDYQVTAGKTFYGTYIIAQGSAGATYIILSYGDDVVTNSDTAPTNNIVVCERLSLVTTSTQYLFPIFIAVPAEKYPCIYAGTGSTYAHILGKEV